MSQLENVLLHRSGAFKLCDLGSSTNVPVITFPTKKERVKNEEFIGKFTTPIYRAPEMWELQKQMDTKVDVWVRCQALVVV